MLHIVPCADTPALTVKGEKKGGRKEEKYLTFITSLYKEQICLKMNQDLNNLHNNRLNSDCEGVNSLFPVLQATHRNYRMCSKVD